ncbi:glycoside hydrolase family 16 protein [Nocardioides panacisoli]|uniref:GH16 domain-containing protein n=1 Tax=Nocardioides panacisoli TaxID=627624 RepID=A0ABP7IX09_9ACTN
MRIRFAVATSAIAAIIAGFAFTVTPSLGVERVTLERPHIEGKHVVLTGSDPALTTIRILRRISGDWVDLTSERSGPTGRYRIDLPRPAGVAWIVLASARGAQSRVRTVRPSPIDTTPSDACGPGVRKADGSFWACTFVDDFSAGALDSAKWVPQQTSITGVANGTACLLAGPDQISVTDGSATLRARHLATPITCKSPYGDFVTDRVSSTITTKGLFSQAYGRFSFRAQFSTARVPGAHSAVWLYPDRQTYGRWPLSGEVDVAEWFSALPAGVFSSLHYVDGRTNVHTGRAHVVDVSRWHVYTVEWTPPIMRFYLDGTMVYQHTWRPSDPLRSPQPFDQPFNVVLTQGWGQLWNAPVATTPQTVEMKIDYVRVWK